MRSSPSLQKVLAVLALAAPLGLTLSSCSDPVNDSIGAACRVVAGCVDISVGECVDYLGDQVPACTDCIAGSSCEDYSSCQRDVAGCRIPTVLLP